MRRILVLSVMFLALGLSFLPRGADAFSFSNLRAENIYGPGAQIKWTTDESGDSKVYYGTSPGNYPNHAAGDCLSPSSPVFEHCVNLTNLAASTKYYYVVKTTVASGSYPEYTSEEKNFDSATSSSTSTSTSTGTSPPAAPSGFIAALSGNDVKLDWQDNSSDESDFKIFRRPQGGIWAFIISLSQNVTSFTEFGFAVNFSPGTYEYHVNACNPAGCSPDSNIVSVSIGGAPPSTTTTEATSSQPTAQTTVVSGIALDPIGKAVAGAGVRIFKEDFSRNYGILSGADGSWKISGVEAGNYWLEAMPPPERTELSRAEPFRFSISDNETKVFTLKFVGTSKNVSGAASFSDGTPISDAEVGAYSSETKQWKSVFVDSGGRYNLALSGGIWQLGTRPRDPASAKWSWNGPFSEVVFADDITPESRTVNFVIPISDSKVIISVRDEAGKPLEGAGIMLDTLSAGDQSSLRPPPDYKKSDAQGLATFLARAGTYYLRAFLPSELGYLNPEEQKISILSGETKDIAFVFRRPTLFETVKVFGTTKISGVGPVDAFVWAWSEKGGNVNLRASAGGEFIAVLQRGDKWRIGAGKEENGIPYKSGEIILDTSQPVGLVELILERYGLEALPPPVSTSQSATKEIFVQTADGAEVRIPPSAAGTSGTVSVEITPTIEAPSQPAAKVVSTVYEVTIKDSAGTNIETLQDETEIVIPYDPEVLKDQGITEDAVVPSFFDESTGVWVKVESYTVDKIRKVFILRVTHLTIFALVAAADTTPPNPPTNVTASYGTDGSIVISWINPTADFSHVRVYRSTERGFLGDVIATNLKKNTLTDINVTKGVVYYYVVRAVDPAGNETSNKNQVVIEATQTLSVPQGAIAKLEILRNLSAGSSGEDVKALQSLLLAEGVYPQGLITGFFGELTRQAVIRFQEKYADEVLAPAGLTSGNGFVGPLTRKKVNALTLGAAAPAAEAPPAETPPQAPLGQATKAEILRDLTVGSTGEDVKALQELLLAEGVYTEGLITGFFGSLTKQAVIRFQEKYADEVLAPAGLVNGTGYVGPATRAKIQEL
ncbi:MAG: peptidoglycan-binding protein [Patescibacteria group bacterium]